MKKIDQSTKLYLTIIISVIIISLSYISVNRFEFKSGEGIIFIDKLTKTVYYFNYEAKKFQKME